MTEKEKDDLEETDLDVESIESESQDLYEDTATYKINTYGADFTLEILSQKLREGEIKVPPFQRRYVWPEKKASRLIESCLLGLPIPQIFLYRDAETQELLVVDGQQRLKSIHYFLAGYFEDGRKFNLKSVKDEWEGKNFRALSSSDQRKFKNVILRATIFEQIDPADNSSVFEIFERLNTGGMALTQQEIRNCIIAGPITGFLEKLNKNKDWRTLLNKLSPDSRMKDIEMILRFLALNEDWDNYKKPMKDFINSFMKENRTLSTEEAEHYETIFNHTMALVKKKIGVGAFKVKSGINIALFDSICVAIATVGVDRIEGVKTKYDKLKKNKKFIESISKSTTDIDRVQGRIRMAIDAFSS